MKSRKFSKGYIFYILLIMIACVSFVFTNVSYDAEYQMAMAYRLIKGDKMILQMWEPHQTSAFLCAALMKIYMVVTGTTTGIVLYLQIVGLLIRAGLATYFYKVVKKVTGVLPAFVVGGIYLIISPKELLIPEFGNMQLWFGTLLFFAILGYLENKKIIQLIMAAVFLCLGVLSYPSFIIVYMAVIVVFLKYSESGKRDVCIFTGICALMGGAFLLYVLSGMRLEVAVECVKNALSVEPSHTVSLSNKIMAHILNVCKITVMLLGTAGIGLVAEIIVGCIREKKEQRKFNCYRWLMISWYVLMFCLLLNILSVSNRGGYSLPFVVLLVFGIWSKKFLSADEKKMYDVAWLISGMSLLATLLLSDNAFIQAITYMLIVICVSVIPVYRWFETIRDNVTIRKMFIVGVNLFFVLIIFRCVFIHIPIYGRSQIYAITSDISLIRSGPAAGMITEEGGAARQRDSVVEWEKYVQRGDTIWILGEPVDTLGYLYEDVNVGAPTVMSTPTYNEKLLYYWELNPEKFPDVIIVASSFGELAWEMQTNQWLMNWIEEEYCAETVVDGNYWRYYIKRRSN